MIVPITHETICDVNKVNEPFDIIGRIIPRYENDTWTYTEVLYPDVRVKQYPNDEEDFAQYIDNKNKAIFFCYDGGICIGQIKMHQNWGKYAFIDELFVSRNNRGKGVGRALIHQAIQWAKQNELMGLMVETQDNNLLACRFYAKCGFRIGGVDDMVYSNFPHIANEKAVYWYLKW